MTEANLVRLFETEATAPMPEGLPELSASIMKLVAKSQSFDFFQNFFCNSGSFNNDEGIDDEGIDDEDIRDIVLTIKRMAHQASLEVRNVIPSHLSRDKYVEQTYRKIEQILNGLAISCSNKEINPSRLELLFLDKESELGDALLRCFNTNDLVKFSYPQPRKKILADKPQLTLLKKEPC